MPRPLSRRAMLRGVGGAAVSLPFLSAMLRPLQSHAQGTLQKRLVVFFTPNGTVPEAWRPVGSETSFTLPTILAPLAAHQAELIVLDGVDMKSALEHPGGGNPHDVGTGHCLTPWPIVEGASGVGEFGHYWDGSAGGQSFDQYVAERLTAGHPFDSLVWGVEADNSRAIPARISWKGTFNPVRPMQEPAAAFDRIFGSGGAHSAGPEVSRSQRLFVVDAVLEDFQRLHARVGAEDRLRLDAHVEALFDLEQTIRRLDLGDCLLPERVDASTSAAIGEANNAMMAAAARCDLAPVLVHQWGSGQSERIFTELGQTDDHHALSHQPLSDADAVARLTAINRWYAQRFALLLDQLASTEAGDGTSLLDQSVVLWCNELGNGYTHDPSSVPYVLAGRCGGALSTGRYLRPYGRSHGELFAAIGQALGLGTESFGMPDVFERPLTEILSSAG
ncbi:MAG: DUF1552 domain-containing protein [Myxococcota bacterium]|nr:DUF1552 domain-containing protein [Myxococcota bacterium]